MSYEYIITATLVESTIFRAYLMAEYVRKGIDARWDKIPSLKASPAVVLKTLSTPYHAQIYSAAMKTKYMNPKAKGQRRLWLNTIRQLSILCKKTRVDKIHFEFPGINKPQGGFPF